MSSDYKKITEDNIRRRGEEFDDIGELLSEQLYSDRTHFIYELLQNAEDALAQREQADPANGYPRSVRFSLLADRLEVRHYGKYFDEADVRGISDILKGTKKGELGQIGKFGIGFKSVYAFTASPEVHSGDEHFTIERYIRPCSVAPRQVNDGETLFVFPFNHKDVPPDKSIQLIGDRLRKLGLRTLLFLKHIDEIEWQIGTEAKGIYLKDVKDINHFCQQVTLVGQSVKGEKAEDWLKFQRSVRLPGGNSTAKVEIAFNLGQDPKNKKDTIAKLNESPVYVFFPTEKESRLGFLIQGPYQTTPARDNVPPDNDWNKKLVNETAGLVVTALRQLKKMNFINVGLLDALPINPEGFPEGSFFRPVFDAVRAAFIGEPLLPTDDGRYIASGNAKLARGAELRDLLNDGKLACLYRSEEDLKWLTGDITEGRTPVLRSYLINELSIEELDQESFAKKIDADFLEEQGDNWIIKYYTVLLGHTALWRKARSYLRQSGPLRSRPILRLQNNKHVSPDSSNVFLPPPEETDYLIIKRNIASDEQACDFLKQLGLAHPDIADDVISNILPKYKNKNSESISGAENLQDLTKVFSALKTDSVEKKESLSKLLAETPIVRATNPATGKKSYKSPGEIYISTPDLTLYFQGNPEAWLVDDYEEAVIKQLKQLGVNSSVRISCKETNYGGEVIICNCHGLHRKGLNGFDPDCTVDGLEHALNNITAEKAAFIWNKILIPHRKHIYGTVVSATRQDYSNKEEEQKYSPLGMLVTTLRWINVSETILKKPSDITVDDLPSAFVKDDELIETLKIGNSKAAVAKELERKQNFARELGVELDDIELLRQHHEAFQKWKTEVMQSEQAQPAFPVRNSANPERRAEKTGNGLGNAAQKKYEQKTRQVRTTGPDIDKDVWLVHNYTNDDEQMICQICKQEMPFKKRNGQYYFEAVQLVDDAEIEHHELYLALCPVCAAKFKEFVKRDPEQKEKLVSSIINGDSAEIPVRLDEAETTIQFVERHFIDLKVIMKDLHGRNQNNVVEA